ncbi:MAG: tRNA pseudouridine(38-40) synthase TruA [Thermomicrobiales bacterium]
MQRVRLVLSYDGTAYRGSQIQPGVATIQETLECALRKIRAYGGRTTFAGRTDAGVHAFGQVVSCDVVWERELRRLSHGLNSVLPSDVRVLRCEAADPDFSARFDALSREYRYRLVTSRDVPPSLGRLAWAREGELDTGLMAEASSKLLGTHSFGSFASSGKSRALSRSELRRHLFDCDWRPLQCDFFPTRTGAGIYELRVRANGFLPQMVRNIVSALVEVGSGNKSPEWIEYLLVSGDRRLLGPPAPPHGLFLWHVEYAGDSDTHTGNTG